VSVPGWELFTGADGASQGVVIAVGARALGSTNDPAQFGIRTDRCQCTRRKGFQREIPDHSLDALTTPLPKRRTNPVGRVSAVAVSCDLGEPPPEKGGDRPGQSVNHFGHDGIVGDAASIADPHRELPTEGCSRLECIMEQVGDRLGVGESFLGFFGEELFGPCTRAAPQTIQQSVLIVLERALGAARQLCDHRIE
jgi:hypothetical protein